jgi:hypothetical protein
MGALICKKADNKITGDDFKTYKSVLQLTNGHLEKYKPGSNVATYRSIADLSLGK